MAAFDICLLLIFSDPNPKVEQIYHNVGDDNIRRVQNFSILNRHLRSYYQVLKCIMSCVLQHVIVPIAQLIEHRAKKHQVHG